MKSVIYSESTIFQALSVINELSGNANDLTLFVIDENNRLLGTLTDGDIRRSILNGACLNSLVINAMHENCKIILEGDKNFVNKIHAFRSEGIKSIPVIDREGCIIDIIDLTSFKTRLPIDAVLMAGGKGERLRPLTEKTPKPLIKIGDKCIIDYNVDRLITYGIKHISATVNYLGEQIEEHFSTERDGIKIKTVREPKYLGTIGSIRFIETFYNDTILVMNSDLFTNIDYEDFYLHFKEHDADMSVAAVPYIVKVPYGVFNLEGRDIKGVTEKPTISYYANAGIYLIKKELLELIPENKFYNATDFMSNLINNNYKVIRYPISGYWIDIGQHHELERAKEIVKHIK